MIPYMTKLENANYQLEVVNENRRRVLSQLNVSTHPATTNPPLCPPNGGFA